MMTTAKMTVLNRARVSLRSILTAAFDRSLRLPKKLSGSEWADIHGVIPEGTGAESGKIHLYGYQRGVLDAMCDQTIPRITILKAARVGYTRLVTLALGYHLEHEATLCAIAQPVSDDAADYARSEIGPMLRDTEALAALLRPIRKATGDGQDTITDVRLKNGGVLRIRGAASDDAFRRYDARFMAADEYDAEGWNSERRSSQGDKLKLFWTRGEKFWNRKLVVGSTPLLKDSSRTWREWLKSDQRRYFVPCPLCTADNGGTLSGFQYLEWTDRETPYGVKWSRREDGSLDDVFYVCKHCARPFDESHKHWMDINGEWRATNPNAQEGHVGFHMWTGMALHANASWRTIVQEWFDALEDPQTLVQPFINLRTGMPFQATFGQDLKIETFKDRLELYDAEVPKGVKYLVSASDVQTGTDPRIETSVYGIGANMEKWLIGHFVHRGDTAQPDVWDELDALLLRGFKGEGGREFFVQASVIDAGDGNRTEEVRTFCRARISRRVWAIKGRSETLGKRSNVWPRKPSQKDGNIWYMVGGNAARDYVYGSLAVLAPGARYIHFPINPPDGSVPCDDEFFKQLTREKLAIRKGGYSEWVKPREAHEAGVCLVYAYAAVCGLQSSSRRWVEATENRKGAETPQEEPKIPEKKRIEEPRAHIHHMPPPKKKSDWLNGRGKNWLNR